jgi:hypothetical protein
VAEVSGAQYFRGKILGNFTLHRKNGDLAESKTARAGASDCKSRKSCRPGRCNVQSSVKIGENAEAHIIDGESVAPIILHFEHYF